MGGLLGGAWRGAASSRGRVGSGAPMWRYTWSSCRGWVSGEGAGGQLVARPAVAQCCPPPPPQCQLRRPHSTHHPTPPGKVVGVDGGCVNCPKCSAELGRWQWATPPGGATPSPSPAGAPERLMVPVFAVMRRAVHALPMPSELTSRDNTPRGGCGEERASTPPPHLHISTSDRDGGGERRRSQTDGTRRAGGAGPGRMGHGTGSRVSLAADSDEIDLSASLPSSLGGRNFLSEGAGDR